MQAAQKLGKMFKGGIYHGGAPSGCILTSSGVVRYNNHWANGKTKWSAPICETNGWTLPHLNAVMLAFSGDREDPSSLIKF
jgi:hypothetical protein